MSRRPNILLRSTFGRYFAPFDPNRPSDVGSLNAHNHVVLYDRATGPGELVNLAGDVAHEALDRPGLMGLPPWHGDQAPSRA
jgi:hypothetical protein